MLDKSQIEQLKKILSSENENINYFIIACYDFDRDFYDKVGKEIKLLRSREADEKVQCRELARLLLEEQRLLSASTHNNYYKIFFGGMVVLCIVFVVGFMFRPSISFLLTATPTPLPTLIPSPTFTVTLTPTPPCLSIASTPTAQQLLDRAGCLVDSKKGENKFEEAAQVLLTGESEFFRVPGEYATDEELKTQGQELTALNIQLGNLLTKTNQTKISPNTWADISLLHGRLAEAISTTTETIRIYADGNRSDLRNDIREADLDYHLGNMYARYTEVKACEKYINSYNKIGKNMHSYIQNTSSYTVGDIRGLNVYGLSGLNALWLNDTCSYAENIQNITNTMRVFDFDEIKSNPASAWLYYTTIAKKLQDIEFDNQEDIDELSRQLSAVRAVINNVIDEKTTSTCLFDNTNADTCRENLKELVRTQYSTALDKVAKDGVDLYATAQCNLGGYYIYNENYDDAADAIKKGLNLADKLGFEFIKATCTVGLGDLYFRKDSYDEAKIQYQLAYDILKKLGDDVWLGTAAIRLASSYEINETTRLGIRDYFTEALTIAQRFGNLELLQEVVDNGVYIAAGYTESTHQNIDIHREVDFYLEQINAILAQNKTIKIRDWDKDCYDNLKVYGQCK